MHLYIGYYLVMFGASRKEQKKAPLSVFFATTVVLFGLSLSAADSIGLVPNYIDGTTPVPSVALSSLPMLGQEAATSTPNAANSVPAALPERISIPSIDMDLPIQNPATTDVDALDALLQQGPARYAPSAKLGQDGNVVIFAHSSHLPIVHNQMFKAFNRVPELKEGDTIMLTGGGKTYIYSVDSVSKADTSNGQISLATSQGKRLTLVTCDTLTGKSARFVLTATFVGVSE
jgi:LPXTG-site transpeptidase (sortase) family protein